MSVSVLASMTAALSGAAASHGFPFFEMGSKGCPIPFTGSELPIQAFGVIVAAGVLIGAEVMRRLAIRHGIDEDDLRGLTGWVVVTGFVGAHVFDVLAYQHDKLGEDPLLMIKLWAGISSYGGFLGGAMGYAFYVWWKRLTPGLIADVTTVGLVLGFSIGRIGCTVVHDHIGRATSFALGTDYPRDELLARGLGAEFPGAGAVIRAHNLGMYELMYLVPVNIAILYLAFQRKRRLPAGLLAVLAGLLYAPVRFFLEFLRLNESDPRYVGMTFAQWSSIVAFAVAAYVAWLLVKRGKPAPTLEELGGRPGGRRASLAAIESARAAPGKASKGGKTVRADEKAEAKADAKADAKAEAKAEAKADEKAEAAEADAKADDAEADAAGADDEGDKAAAAADHADDDQAADAAETDADQAAASGAKTALASGKAKGGGGGKRKKKDAGKGKKKR